MTPEDVRSADGPDPESPEDGRLAEILDAYLGEVEAGREVDVEALIAEHPTIADRLRDCLGVLRAVGQVTDPDALRDGEADGGWTPLGDYRILRQVGRGGMGIVYEAEQVSLGRRVALKILPFASSLDPPQLARFKLEAQAAAQLHHANIVPIHAIGSERGVHYYAMQFIDGRTLDDLIGDIRRSEAAEGLARPPKPDPTDSEAPAQTPSPSTLPSNRGRAYFRAVAELGVQAAEALDHAHRLGIVHRDVKPANLILDDRGNLWITDFGLARVQSSPGLTSTGNVLGTLRYMSPEQALARRDVVDHRADIYSLGATLYELLTLRPVFEGGDRAALLLQIERDEPRPPRRLAPSIPPDFETIVLKALAKEPSQRYATAKDLADDLRRHLDHRPIHARRPTPWQRVAKWVRRHPGAVTSVLLVLVVSLGALSSGTLIVSLERDEAIAQRKRADRRLDQARRVVDRLYTNVARNRLENQPKMQGLQHELLQEALGFYRELIEEEGVDPGVRREMASAYFRVGEIVELLGRYAEAEEAYRRCLALREPLVAEFPDRDDLSDELASVLINLGDVTRIGDRMAEFRALAGRAYDIRFALAARFLGNLSYRDALAYDVARCGYDFEEQDLGRCQLLFRRVFGPDLEPPPGTPMTPGYRRALARAQVTLGQILSIAGRHAESEIFLRRSLTLYSGFVEEGIGTLEDRRRVAICLDRLGLVYTRTGRQAELRKAFGRSLSAWDDLIAAFPDVPVLKRDRAWTAAGIAWALSVRPGPGDDPARAVTLAREAIAMGPGDYGFRRSLGATLYRAGKFVEAAAELAESERLNIKDGPDPRNEFFLAMVHARLGDAAAALSWFDRATALVGRRRWSEREERVLSEEAGSLLGVLIRSTVEPANQAPGKAAQTSPDRQDKRD